MKTSSFFFLTIIILLSFFSAACQKQKEEPVFSKSTVNEKDNPEFSAEKITDENNTAENNTETGIKTGSRNEQGGYTRIKPSDAREYIGRKVIVEGYVADVVVREKVAYLNFEKRYPDNPFTGVVFASDFEKFGDLEDYKGKTVTLTGKVTEYRGKPQIILNSPKQIK